MKFETFSNFLPNWTVLQLAWINSNTKMQLRVHVKPVLVDQQSIQSDWSTKGTLESLHGAVFALVYVLRILCILRSGPPSETNRTQA